MLHLTIISIRQRLLFSPRRDNDTLRQSFFNNKDICDLDAALNAAMQELPSPYR